MLSEGTPIYRADLSADDRALLAPAFLLTAKPMLVVCNSGEQPDVPPVIAGAVSVPIDIEAEIAAIEPDARAEMREMSGVGKSTLAQVAGAAYLLLGRRTFLTTGDKESPRGRSAPVRRLPVRGRDPLRLATRLHPRRGNPLGRTARDRPGPRSATPASSTSRARTTRSPTATSSRSASTCSRIHL